MREIVLDTETTGFDPATGDRIVEIGAVEIENYVTTGNHFHRYINPERDMPDDAFRVHGLSTEFLADFPPFEHHADDFLEFIGDSNLVIHNASFDMRFLNAELVRCNRPAIPMERAVDTLKLAQRKFPGSPASLDALCRRFEIDTSARTLHGALLDSELLAEVYLHLMGGRQAGLELVVGQDRAGRAAARAAARGPARPPRPFGVSEAELAAHEAFIGKMKDPLWKRLAGE